MSKISVLLNEFDKGRRAVIRLEDVTVTISREKGAWGYDLIHVDIENEVDIKKWLSKGETLDEVPQQKKHKGNQTAGLPPYALTHGDKIRERLAQKFCKGSVIAQKAALLDLSSYIEMGTGRLRKGWENNHRDGNESLTIKDIAKIIGKQERQAKTIVKDLIINGLIHKKPDGYYLDRKFILRGQSVEEEENDHE